MENMMISGKWVNPKTGQKVNIINNVIDGNDMQLILDNGEMLSMNEFADFIQVSDEVYDEQGKQIGSEKVNYDNIISEEEIYNEIRPKRTDRQLLKDILEDPEPPKPKVNPVVKKFFDKIENIDKMISIDVNMDVIPLNDLKTIINYMDLKIEDIAQYITDNIIDKKYIATIVTEKFNLLFNDEEES